MKRRIHILLLQESHGWKNILNQTGVSWSNGLPVGFSDFDASCIIVNRDPDKVELTQIQSFIENGGTAVDTTGALIGEKPESRRITVLKPYLDASFGFKTTGTIHLRNRTKTVKDSANLKGAVSIEAKSRIAFWGIDNDQFYEGFEKSLHTFTHSSLPSVSERTARCSSGEVTRLLLLLLIRLHQHSELPFIRKWPDIKSNKMPATFRIDYDFGKDETVLPLAELLKNYKIPATWYLHTDALTDQTKKVLKNIPEFELGLHCHRHIEFKTAEEYKSDIRHGLEQFNGFKSTPAGYAAPYGNWSSALQQAIESFDFIYSSEFCYDYDSMPSLPVESKTIQIPVHPVSIGTLNRFKYNNRMMSRYFEEVVQLKKLRFEPLHLYHHPNDRNEDVLTQIFDQLKNQNYRFMTYSEYVESWKLITESDAHFYSDGDKVEVKYPYPAAIHIDESITITNEKDISLNELNFVSFADERSAKLIRQREENETLSTFKRLKYGFLAWRWRNKT